MDSIRQMLFGLEPNLSIYTSVALWGQHSMLVHYLQRKFQFIKMVGWGNEWFQFPPNLFLLFTGIQSRCRSIKILQIKIFVASGNTSAQLLSLCRNLMVGFHIHFQLKISIQSMISLAIQNHGGIKRKRYHSAIMKKWIWIWVPWSKYTIFIICMRYWGEEQQGSFVLPLGKRNILGMSSTKGMYVVPI